MKMKFLLGSVQVFSEIKFFRTAVIICVKMSEQLDIKRRHLLNILPKDHEYIIQGISVRESNDIPKEVKLDAEIRVNVKDGKGFCWFSVKALEHRIIKETRQIKLERGQFCMVCGSTFIMSMRKRTNPNLSRIIIKQENLKNLGKTQIV